MKITFTRSGGIAGPATSIEGTVTFDGGVGHVTSSLGYQRDLAPEELQLLRAAVGQFPQEQPAPPSQLRDAYQYDMRFVRGDGYTYNLAVYGEASPLGLENLLGWIRRECDRIWSHRINTQRN